MLNKPTDDYDEVDMDALRRAMSIAMEQPGRREQLEDMLDEPRPWHQVARFASYCCQMRALELKPWQSPPCWADADDRESSELLDRMLTAGISQWEPNPTFALAAKEKKRK